jgi:hypothetical protein
MSTNDAGMAEVEEPRLNRSEASEFLTKHGYRTATSTLGKMATIGGGPEFEKFGRLPLYRPSNLLTWAKSRCTRPRRSTSEAA